MSIENIIQNRFPVGPDVAKLIVDMKYEMELNKRKRINNKYLNSGITVFTIVIRTWEFDWRYEIQNNHPCTPIILRFIITKKERIEMKKRLKQFANKNRMRIQSIHNDSEMTGLYENYGTIEFDDGQNVDYEWEYYCYDRYTIDIELPKENLNKLFIFKMLKSIKTTNPRDIISAEQVRMHCIGTISKMDGQVWHSCGKKGI